MDWDAAGPPFFDDDGHFLSPEHAATHAIIVQGGSAHPHRDAHRMVRDGGVLRERAEAWLAETDCPGAATCFHGR